MPMKTNYLKKALELRGLTLRGASVRSGIPYATIAAHCSGSRRMGLQSILRYSRLLGISPDELVPEVRKESEDSDATA